VNELIVTGSELTDVFLIVTVYVTEPPGSLMWRVAPSAAVPAVLTTSIVGATSTKVDAVAVLLAVLLSFADETVALFVIEPSVEGVVTTIEKLAVVFAAIDALVQVTLVVAVSGQVHPLPLALTKVTPLGRVSVTLTDVAEVVRELLVTATE
jgi:hypothetical protein